jgi:hypothetical protein
MISRRKTGRSAPSFSQIASRAGLSYPVVS